MRTWCRLGACIPTRSLWQYLTLDELGRLDFISSSLFLCVLIAFLLHPYAQVIIRSVMPEEMVASATTITLLAADSFIFPVLYLNGGLCCSLSMRLAGEDETRGWSVAYISQLQSILGNVGRCIGPPVSRVILDSLGRGFYSMILAALLFIFLCCYRIFVEPAMRRIVEA